MKRILQIIIIVIIIGISHVLYINLYVINNSKNRIISSYESIKGFDCIIVLGAGVWGDEPSPLLRDRLLKGIELYEKQFSPKIIMSGDHGRKNYDEVNIMKDFAIGKGVPSNDIFMDHAGFSTYESIYRAKEIFKAKKVIIVTQEYHLYRSLYIAEQLGLEAYGVSTEDIRYSGEIYRELREILARNKDFIMSIFKPKPTYLGEEIPVNGNGNITNDKI